MVCEFKEIPSLADGERYIGAFVTDDPALRHHLILLPGDNNNTTWAQQMQWAKGLGGDLPSRAELAILFAVARDEFQSELYWSNQQHTDDAYYAWAQHFGNGSLDGVVTTLYKLHARAVRRVPIE